MKTLQSNPGYSWCGKTHLMLYPLKQHRNYQKKKFKKKEDQQQYVYISRFLLLVIMLPSQTMEVVLFQNFLENKKQNKNLYQLASGRAKAHHLVRSSETYKYAVRQKLIKLNINLIFSPYFRTFILVLFMQKIKKNCWSTEQIELLSALHPQFSSKRWKRIAEEFRARGFERSEIECREKWINFLDPEVNRRGWEQWELRKLYEVHAQVGTRWCLVQKAIGRTQNKIKNHFYGTLRNLIRFVLAFFDAGQTCYNSEISHLPPNFLNALYNATQEFAFLGSEVKDAIYAMNFRVEKQLLTQRIEEKRDLYIELNLVLKQEFSNPKATQSSQSSEERPAGPLCPQAALVVEPVSFNNQIESNTGVSLGGSALQFPINPWSMLPMMNYQHPGMFYWYA